MVTGSVGPALGRFLAVLLLWSTLALGAAAPAAAQSSGQFRTELNEVRLKIRALWGELDRFQPKSFYCHPPYGPLKQPDEMLMTAWSQRANALNQQYLDLRERLKDFLEGNHTLAAQLMVNGLNPLDDRWWSAYEAERQRMLRVLAEKKEALKRAPVRDCTPKVTQVADPFQPPSSPQPPSYAEVSFPTVPTHFCSEEEYWKFINEVINPQVLRAAENAEKAAEFRSAVEQVVNAYVQAGRPVPADVIALRRRAQEEFTRQQQIFDRLAGLRDRAGRTPIIDCDDKEESHGSVGTPGFLPPGNDMYSRVWRAYRRFEDGRDRCDQAQMAEALAELERLAEEAQRTFSGIAGSMHGGPFDQEPSPENLEYHDAEADARAAKMALERAKAAQARDCVPCTDPPLPAPQVSQGQGSMPRPAPQVIQGPTSSTAAEASRALATWIGGTNVMFWQLRLAADARNCTAIVNIIAQIALRFGRAGGMQPGMAAVPAEIRLTWRWIFLKALEACRPRQPDDVESILDEIDYVPVIAQAPADPTSAALLAYHNQLRAEVGSPPLRWNPALAANAMQYAQVLADTGQLQHASRQGRENERENIILDRRGRSSALAMARTWGAEKRHYRPQAVSFPGVCTGDWSTCAHYTQAVWSDTKEVGCGFARGRQFDALVCRYSPPGNQDGRPVIRPRTELATQPRRCPPALTALRYSPGLPHREAGAGLSAQPTPAPAAP